MHSKIALLSPLILCFLPTTFGYQWEEKHYEEMPIDHFNYDRINQTFSLRYLLNTTHWDDGSDGKRIGPIFFYCGNEGKIELFAENTGFMWELAGRLRAAVVFAEHRYYGQSQPYGTEEASYSSLHNLGTLSAGQALADFAVLISALKGVHASVGAGDHRLSESALLEHAPVVAFGGSYGGMLASWFRMKYPHIVVGALASSAPIRQYDVDCGTYNHIATRTFADAVPGCEQVVKDFWPAAQKLVDAKEAGVINDMFKLCDGSKLPTDGDESSGDKKYDTITLGELFSWLYDGLSQMPMIDYPYPTEFIAPVPAKPVTVACKLLKERTAGNGTDAALMDAMAGAIQVFVDYKHAKKCYNIKENTTPSLGVKGWDFQLCTDQTQPWCANAEDMFVPYGWNLTDFTHNCEKEYFGVRPRPQWIAQYFGWEQLRAASNIIFSNGALDPWSGGGILPEMRGTLNNPSVEILYIEQGAHHYDLRAAHEGDTGYVVANRLLEERTIKEWIKWENAAAGVRTASVALVGAPLAIDLLLTLL